MLLPNLLMLPDCCSPGSKSMQIPLCIARHCSGRLHLARIA